MVKEKNIIQPDDAALKAAEAIKRTKDKIREPKAVQEGLKNIIDHATAVEKAEKQKKKQPLSKEEKAKKKLAEAKKRLEEAKKKNDAKAIEKAQKQVKKAEEALKKVRGKKDLWQTAKEDNKNRKEREKMGMKEDPAKDDKAKRNTQSRDKEQVKSEQKAKLASRINTNGLNIQQHAAKYVLVGKNGQETDVTDIMNQIDKYNKGVDAQNAATLAQGAVQQGINGKTKDMAASEAGLPKNARNDAVAVRSQAETVPAVPQYQQKAAEDMVAVKHPQLDAEEKSLVAKTALQLSKSDLLKDPKAMEKLNERKKQNEEKERQRRLREQQQNMH